MIRPTFVAADLCVPLSQVENVMLQLSQIPSYMYSNRRSDTTGEDNCICLCAIFQIRQGQLMDMWLRLHRLPFFEKMQFPNEEQVFDESLHISTHPNLRPGQPN